ncbi:ribonuclease T2 [Sphingomonas laterariae]|uniref:Ribonuclease T2 n=1 Tax=Edaphosphingomonas laterariae TaxID=861865 RepID=A0A239ET89_9SPHN|nr:ribonuclease T [Sphingomonas laterariae]SNS47243.1 ribonuclease T2 [Sphingomonas laterariae]
MIRQTLAALPLALTLLPSMALAQARDCRVPAVLPRPALDGPTASQPRRALPIGGYTLALSWSPEYCRTRLNSVKDRFQCGGGAGPRFGFVLHGLWPDGRGEQWPQYCRPAGLLPDRLIRAHLCTTPSVQLMQHEYAKHGTCMNVPPDAYFKTAAGLFNGLRFPDMNLLSRRPTLNARQLAEALAGANKGMDPAMFKIAVNRRGWLDEVRLCLDTALKPRRCRASAPGARAGETVRIWRGGR